MDRVLLALGTVLFIQTRIFATVTLQTGPVTVNDNQVSMPIVLAGDTVGQVSALNFKLNFNPDALQAVSVRPGIAATSADKRVMANISASGTYTVVLIGMNQTTCRSGEIAEVVFERLKGAPSSSWALGISELTLSSPDGTPIEGEAVQPSVNDLKPDTPDVPNKPRPPKPDVTRPDTPAEPTVSGGNDLIPFAPAAPKMMPETVKSAEQAERLTLDQTLEEAARARQALGFVEPDNEAGVPVQPEASAKIDSVSNEPPSKQEGKAEPVETQTQFNNRSSEVTPASPASPSEPATADRKSSGSIGTYAALGALVGAAAGLALAIQRRKRL